MESIVKAAFAFLLFAIGSCIFFPLVIFMGMVVDEWLKTRRDNDD